MNKITLILLVSIIILLLSSVVGGVNKVYYPGRYFVAKDINNKAVIIDIEDSTYRQVRQYGTNQDLTLAENWSSNTDQK